MKNEKRYKETFNALSPSDEAVERIYELTSDKRKLNHSKAFKNIVAAALAFILVVGGGFGADYAIEKYKSYNPHNTLGVYIAYGSERELIKLNNDIAPELFYRHYILKSEDSGNINEALKQQQQEIDEKLKDTRKFGKPVAGFSSIITDESGKTIGAQYSVSCGEFILDIDDYAKVDKVTIEEESSFSKIVLTTITEKPKDFDENGENYELEQAKDGQTFNQIWYSEVYENSDYTYRIQENDKVTISGNELRESYEISNLSKIKDLLNENDSDSRGYTLELNIDIGWMVEQNIDFDLRKVKSDIVFTVDYTDGTTQSSTVHYQLDKDGLMHLSLK